MISSDSVSQTRSQPKVQLFAYWVTTSVIVLQSAAGALLDLTGNPDFTKVFTQLGYPLYLLIILGVWRILGAVALIVPGFRGLKSGLTPGWYSTSRVPALHTCS